MALLAFPSQGKAQYAYLDSLVACYTSGGEDCAQQLAEADQRKLSEGNANARAYYKAAEKLYQQGFLEQALQLAKKAKDLLPPEADTLTRIRINNVVSAVSLYLGKLDTSLIYANANVALLQEGSDYNKLGRAFVNRGQVYKELGRYPKALDDYLKAIRIFHEIKDSFLVAKTHAELAPLYSMNKEVSKAIFYNREAAAYFKKAGKREDYAYATLNLANDLNYLKQADSALPLLQEALGIFKETGKFYLQMNTEAQLGRSYLLLEKKDLALKHFRISNQLGEEGGYIAQLAYNHQVMSEVFQETGELDSALLHARQSLEYSQEIGFNEEYGNALVILSQVHEQRGEYQKALKFQKQFQEVQDSLFSIEKSKQLLEIQEKYESDLKEERLKSQEAEISLLETQSRVQWIRNIALGIGLLLTLIIALLVINRQRIKMKLNQRLAGKKEELHQSQLNEKEATERQLRSELDHKKRELTSQALLIAEKNELLRSFKEQLRAISQNGNGSGKIEMNKLAHRIERAENTSEDWDKFMRIFEEVHPDFLQKLQIQYEGLTSNDLRLVALMRMNLSNKEIASILHISDDGLKKARYRLRKRLSLASEENIQEFLMQEA